MTLSIGVENLAFLDGYLFRVMLSILKAEGADASGLYEFYQARIERAGYALSEYDRMLLNYAHAHFDPRSRRIVHAGTGLGTLPAALAAMGHTVAGIEQDESRFRTAVRLRAALTEAWPSAAERYVLIPGEFPTVLGETSWISADTVLIFTNCGAGWSEELTDRIIGSFSSYGDIILDTRLFGNIRNTPEERATLMGRFEAQGLMGTSIAGSPRNAFYHHLQPRRPTP